jgi:uncharacterized protein YdeI (YjbR/CyaY-like superfamily)
VSAAPPDDLPVLGFATRADWRAWLETEHDRAPGVWMQIAKRGGGGSSVSYAEAVEAALCFGWIDSQTRSLDDSHWLQRFTPRRSRSRWSKRNRAAAEALIERGEMHAAGLREVEAARADGRWAAAYDGARTATVPDDLRVALDADPAAAAAFAALDGRNRYAVLHRIQTAKRPETRARRIERFVAMLAAGETLHP